MKIIKSERDYAKVEKSLETLKRAVMTYESLMPMIIDAVKAYATIGEMCNVMKDVFGEYNELKTI